MASVLLDAVTKMLVTISSLVVCLQLKAAVGWHSMYVPTSLLAAAPPVVALRRLASAMTAILCTT